MVIPAGTARRSHRGGGLTDKINFRIGCATSNNATQWTKVPGSAGAGAVVGLGTGHDAKGAACPSVLKEGSTYRMWYEAYDGTARRILYATSSDGITWTKRGLALDIGGANTSDELGVAGPVVIRRKNRYELWYQGQGKSAPNYRILRAVSNDGNTFSQLDEIALHPSPAVSGSERIHVHSAIVQPDNKVQVFFAKEKTTARNAGYCIQNVRPENVHSETVTQNRGYGIYTEMVDPNP